MTLLIILSYSDPSPDALLWRDILLSNVGNMFRY